MKNYFYTAVDALTLAISQVITAKSYLRILAAAVVTAVLHISLAVVSSMLYNTAHRNILATAVALYLVYAFVQAKRKKQCHWKIAIPATIILTCLLATVLMYTQYFLRNNVVLSYVLLFVLVCGALQAYKKIAA